MLNIEKQSVKDSKHDTMPKKCNRLTAFSIVILALFTAIIFILQVVLSGIPNVELVSLLVILYTLLVKKKVFYIIYSFALLEGLIYGFGIWWFMYLYVWTILALLTLLFQKQTSSFFWAILSSAFGLSFGFLCSLPYFITGGIYTGFSYWIAGIPFDILHAVSNFIIALLLFKPFYSILSILFRSRSIN